MKFTIALLFLILTSCGGARFEQHQARNPERSNGGGGGGNPTKPGDDPTRYTDVFVQDPGGNQVDILVISDDSYSMYKDQKKLGTKFSNFIENLAGIDWNVGITTSDVTDSGLKGSLAEFSPGLKVLTPKTPNALKLFLDTVTRECNDLGSCGSSSEQPLAATIHAMNKANTDNKGFFRPNVDLAVLVITDEDEMSNGKSKLATRPEQVIAHFSEVFQGTKNLAVYGIIIRPGDAKCLAEQREEDLATIKRIAAQYGVFVHNLARMTEGKTFSICANDYSPALREIGTKLHKLVHSFELSGVPNLASVVVALRPHANIPYHIEGNRIVFATAPAPGTEIRVTWEAAPEN